MTAEEYYKKKYPKVVETWNCTGHDDGFTCRMMEEYARYYASQQKSEIEMPTKEKMRRIANKIFWEDFPYERKLQTKAFMLCDKLWRDCMKGTQRK